MKKRLITRLWGIVVYLLFLNSNFIFGQNYELSDTTFALNLLDKSDSLAILRDTDKALELAHQAQKIFLETIGSKHLYIVHSWDAIGKIYFHGGKFDKAEKAFLTGLELLNDISRNSRMATTLYNNLGYTSLSQVDYKKAMKYMQLAYRNELQNKGSKEKLAKQLFSIAITFQYMEKNDSAYIYHLRSLQIRAKIPDIDPLILAKSYLSIGTVLSDLDKPKEGLVYQEKAFDIYVSKFGESSIKLDVLRNNLAETYSKLGEIDKAIEIAKKRLYIILKEHIPDSVSISLANNNLGNYYLSKGYYIDAKKNISNAISFFPSVYGDHPMLGAFYGNLGVVYSHLGKIRKAIAYHKKSIKIKISKQGNNSLIANSYHNLAVDYLTIEENNKAIESEKMAIKILLAMAPFFKEDKKLFVPNFDSVFGRVGWKTESLGVLFGSGEEVKTIAQIFGESPFLGDNATILNFMKWAKKYDIIHLATHAKADDRMGDYAYLAFSSTQKGKFEKLYARDLYQQKLNTKLVVLSACETGTGKLQKGEGIICFSRAFAFIGVQSIITSLWKINDQSTKDIFIQFYRNLKDENMDKDEALQKAKIHYLKQNRGTGLFLHPYFWSGLIGIGDMSRIEK